MKAFELIETFDWIQEEFGDKARGFCALMAIYSAYGHMNSSDAINKLSAHTGYECIAQWNDKEEQTKQEVIDALKLLNL